MVQERPAATMAESPALVGVSGHWDRRSLAAPVLLDSLVMGLVKVR
jgi:hypothetical protein